MKSKLALFVFVAFSLCSLQSFAQESNTNMDEAKGKKNLYIDVHRLEPGKVKYEDVAKAHAKDLQVEKKYGVEFIRYWVDEKKDSFTAFLLQAIRRPSVKHTRKHTDCYPRKFIRSPTDRKRLPSVRAISFWTSMN